MVSHTFRLDKKKTQRKEKKKRGKGKDWKEKMSEKEEGVLGVAGEGYDPVEQGPAVVCCNGDSYKFFQLIPGNGQKLFDREVKLDTIIGHLNYGQIYEFQKGGKFVPLDYNPRTTTRDLVMPGEQGAEEGEKKETEEEINKGRDNRNVYDDNTAQKLSQGDIATMKTEAESGRSIVASLAKSSATYENKTTFAQQKYLRRKMRKYVKTVQVLRPTAAVVAQSYFSKAPQKILGLRADTLAQMITLANLEMGSVVAVAENCNGLLVASVAERLSTGQVYRIHEGKALDGIGILHHFPHDVQNRVIHFPLSRLTKVESKVVSKEGEEVKQEEEEKKEDVEMKEEETEEEKKKREEKEKVEEEKEEEGRKKKKEKGWSDEKIRVSEERKKARKKLLDESMGDVAQGFHSLVISVKTKPIQMLALLYEHLLPGSPFVVFSEFMEPLTRCYHALNVHEVAICMNLTETWMRPYQMMPNRAHPEMKMHAASGYILYGIKCVSQTPFTYSSYSSLASSLPSSSSSSYPSGGKGGANEPPSKRRKRG